jgi:hypothetical protein
LARRNAKHPTSDFMMTISIDAEAFAAVETAFPGDWSAEIRPDGECGYLFTLPDGAIDLLTAIRGPTDSYSDAILRPARTTPW